MTEQTERLTLEQALLNITYDSSWGVWAELINGEPQPESKARYGQKCFENGGMLDGYVYIANGQSVGDWLTDWLYGNEELGGDWFSELIDQLYRH